MATGRVIDDPVLARVRKGLDAIYGAQLERVVLYGSRARGDAHEDSDYDVGVFLHDMGYYFDEVKRLADLSVDILDETGEWVHARPYHAGSYADGTPLMLNLSTDGIDL